MSAPPECGPDAVENAPVTISPSPSTAVPIVQSESRPPATNPSWGSVARAQAMLASPSTVIASRKWLITKYGFRSVSTVIAPSGIWKSVPTATPAHSQRPRRSASERDTHQVTIAATIPQSAIARFENSITAWYCAGGTGPPWQSGQSGQPRPEPLSRTKAPGCDVQVHRDHQHEREPREPGAIRGHDAGDAATDPRRDGDADCHRDSA